MTGQKGARRQPPAALGLKLVNRQDGALATGDAEPLGASFDDLTGSPRPRRGPTTPRRRSEESDTGIRREN